MRVIIYSGLGYFHNTLNLTLLVIYTTGHLVGSVTILYSTYSIPSEQTLEIMMKYKVLPTTKWRLSPVTCSTVVQCTI